MKPLKQAIHALFAPSADEIRTRVLEATSPDWRQFSHNTAKPTDEDKRAALLAGRFRFKDGYWVEPGYSASCVDLAYERLMRRQGALRGPVACVDCWTLVDDAVLGRPVLCGSCHAEVMGRR